MNNKKIQKIGKNVIQFEINALKNLKRFINKNFFEVVKTVK